MLSGEELSTPREQRMLDLLAVRAGPRALLLDGAEDNPGLAEAHELYELRRGRKPPRDACASLALGAGGAPLGGAQVITDLDAAVVDPAVALELPDPVVPGAT